MEDDIEILTYNISQNVSEVVENMAKNKFDMDGLTKNEKARLKLFEEYVDLKATYDSIKNCLIYINSFPFYPRVAKVEYLKFIYSAYLNEIYILQSRILKFTKVIKRTLKDYKEERWFNVDYNIIDSSTNNAIDRFKKIIEIRGAHVHVKRYTTKSIDNVETYEFISRFKGTKQYKTGFKYEIKELKKKYFNKMKKNQEQIDEILKLYLQDIDDFLFKKEYIKKVNDYESNR